MNNFLLLSQQTLDVQLDLSRSPFTLEVALTLPTYADYRNNPLF